MVHRGWRASSRVPSPMQAPNPDDPLNKEAAEAMQNAPSTFARHVSVTITRGGTIGGEYFPPARGTASGHHL